MNGLVSSLKRHSSTSIRRKISNYASHHQPASNEIQKGFLNHRLDVREINELRHRVILGTINFPAVLGTEVDMIGISRTCQITKKLSKAWHKTCYNPVLPVNYIFS